MTGVEIFDRLRTIASAANPSNPATQTICRATGLEPHAAPAAVAVRPIVDQFYAGILERGDQLHQRIDVAPDHRLTRFHPLNGWRRKPRQLREPPLVEAEKHPGSP